MEMEFDLTVTRQDLYDYYLSKTYSQMGLIGTVIGALCLLFYQTSGKVLLLIVGIFLIIYFPWSVYYQAGKRSAKEMYGKELHYHLSEIGIVISEITPDDQRRILVAYPWGKVAAAVSVRKSIVVFIKEEDPLLFPRKSMGENLSIFVEMISTHVPPKFVNIRGAI